MRCQRCKYDLTSLGDAPTCPECGLGEVERVRLRLETKRRAKMWTLIYLLLGAFAILPAVPLLINSVWTALHWQVWPMSQRTTVWLATHDDMVFGMCAGAFFLTWLFSIALVPPQLIFLSIVLWTRYCTNSPLQTGWRMWIVLLLPIVLPIVWFGFWGTAINWIT